jgi:hypothetical protein
MTIHEFPRKPDNASLTKLLGAIAAEGTANAVDARQRRLAESVALVLGIKLDTDRAIAGFGAFLEDLTAQGGPQDVESMTLAFRRWHDCGPDSASLAEFGLEPHELTGMLAGIAVLLWDTGESVVQAHDVQTWDSALRTQS